MLSPEFLAALPESVVALFLQVEEDLLEDIARRIAKMDGITDTAKWQAWRYEQVKLFSSNALQTLAQATGKSKEELVQLFREAALETLAADNEIYTAAGLTVPETLSPTLQNILQSGYLQAGQMMENFTATTANTVTRQFENALDRAWLQINTGGFTYQQAIRKAIQTLAQDGLSAIIYPSGHRDTIETAVRRAVLTGVNQTAAKLQIARMEEMGCEFVEVTAHPGARPSHAVWQGKVFHRGDGTSVNGVYYPPFVQSTGYGTGAGLGGWNCRHNFFPFFPGLSKRAYTNEMLAQLDAKEISYQGKDYTRYEASQMQRALERKIRKAKREYLSLDAAGQDTAESAVKLRRTRAQLNDFLTETGLRQDNFREQVAGFGRSAAARATALAKRTEQAYNQNKAAALALIRSDSFPKTLNRGNQLKHIREEGREIGNRSFLYGTLKDAQELVNEYSGTGELRFDRKGNWTHKEFVKVDFVIGEWRNLETGISTPTHRFTIHYGKKGTHIVPAKEEQ